MYGEYRYGEYKYGNEGYLYIDNGSTWNRINALTLTDLEGMFIEI